MRFVCHLFTCMQTNSRRCSATRTRLNARGSSTETPAAPPSKLLNYQVRVRKVFGRFHWTADNRRSSDFNPKHGNWARQSLHIPPRRLSRSPFTAHSCHISAVSASCTVPRTWLVGKKLKHQREDEIKVAKLKRDGGGVWGYVCVGG